jgi:cytochrome c oxidase subunit 4
MSTHSHPVAAGNNGHAAEPSPATHHVLPLKVYFGVWGALMFFTIITVAAAYVPFEALHVPLALGIASIKALLVALFFMHLLYDEKYNLVLLLSCLGVVGIFLGLTIVDPLTRGYINPISARPIAADMTTTTLQLPPKPAKFVHEGGHTANQTGASAESATHAAPPAASASAPTLGGAASSEPATPAH